MRLMISLMTASSVFFVAAAAAKPDVADLDDNLSIFAALIGGDWSGHFEGADEPFTLMMNWEPILDGAAVEMKGWSIPPGMTRSNIYYWDREKEEVAYLALTSNGYAATGMVQLEDSILTFEGRQTGPDGTVRDTKSCWEFLANGNVRVIGYGLQGGEWVPGHRILYEPAPSH